jgi:plasmid stabilization system protein ParE
MPRAFPVLLKIDGVQIRRKPFRNYLIFYAVHRERIEIVHVIHAARDYEKIFFSE